MRIKLKPLSQQVIVITGASSGIGLATARLAAAQGAKVVLTARSEPALRQAVDAIERAGGQALLVVADIGHADAAEQVAAAAVGRFGRIDTWVNNAGVDILGSIEETSEADMRQLFETDFWGTVRGSKVAVQHLKANGGALVNVGSIESDRAVPLQGIYSASKHAVKGFTDALRVELLHARAPISVTLVKPASVGTPIPQHMKSYSGHEPKLPPPIYAPEDAATILRAAVHPTRDAFVGGAAVLGSFLSQTVPGAAVDWVSAQLLVDSQLGRVPATDGDNLYAGRADGQVRGDHQGSTIRRSVYTNAANRPFATAATLAVLLGGLAVTTLLRRTSGK